MVNGTIDPQLNIYLKTVFTLFTLNFPFFVVLSHQNLLKKKLQHKVDPLRECPFTENILLIQNKFIQSCFRSLPPPFKMVVLMIWISFVRSRATTKKMFNESKKHLTFFLMLWCSHF